MKNSEIERCFKMEVARKFSPSVKGIITFTVNIIAGIAILPQGWAALANPGVEEVISDSEIIEFNPLFIHGEAIDVSRFAEGNPVTPGIYPVTVLVNNEGRGKFDITFKSEPGKSGAQPCFTSADLAALGIKSDLALKGETVTKAQQQGASCENLKALIVGSHVTYDSGEFELSIAIPQLNQVKFPRGYIDPTLWDSGVTAGFLDYNTNLYSLYSGSNGYGSKKSTDYSNNLGLLAGFNLSGWRFRKRLNNTWSDRDGMHTQSLYGYAQTDITPLMSQLTLGDSNTSGEVFDAFTLRGIQLQSDQRMLPEGLRNYVPVLRGVAETNARVRVTQRGQIVYETTIPPGPFELDDIGAMGFGGDLEMSIIESDGRTRIQTIPFSAPPMLLHEGIYQFSLSAGELREDALKNSPNVMQGIFRYGLNNLYTLYGGMQLSEHYRAVAVGNAFNTPVGGISIDGTRSENERGQNKKAAGSSFRIAYSKYVESTNTDFTLAAYRYSTRGFYNFREATLDRYGTKDRNSEPDYRTRQRLSLNIGQRLSDNAYINASGSLYSYWDGRAPSKQYSLSFNKSEKYFSYTVSATRSRINDRKEVNSFMLSVNVPLNGSSQHKPVFSSVYTNYSHDNVGNTSLQANASGNQGDENELNYGVGTAVSRSYTGSSQKSLTGNMNYRSSYGQIGATASINNRAAKQLSLMANGSLVMHEGGVTPGPQLGDSAFAIINVPGGDGGKLLNGYGATIDRHGYAIMPSLTPYRKNTLSVDATALPPTVDILENESTVVPRAGSAVRVSMKTISGEPAILTVRRQNNDFLPIGTELTDDAEIVKTVVGQGGKAFIRGFDPKKDVLYVKGSKSTICRIDPESTQLNEKNKMAQLEVTCF